MLGPWLRRRQRPRRVGGRVAQHVEADATAGPVVPRRQSAPLRALFLISRAAAQGAHGRSPDAGLRAAAGPSQELKSTGSSEVEGVMRDDEFAYMSAAEIAERVRRRNLSPVEIVEACIARIEKRNPSLNAFVFKGFEDARRAARAAEQAAMSGAATGPPHGVPSAIKDLFDLQPG